MLDACKRDTPVGRRDYAILLLLARLGLRAIEIVSLDLDDIDWHAGTLMVHGKGRRCAELPLSADVGVALVNYLERGRSQSRSRRVTGLLDFNCSVHVDAVGTQGLTLAAQHREVVEAYRVQRNGVQVNFVAFQIGHVEFRHIHWCSTSGARLDGPSSWVGNRYALPSHDQVAPHCRAGLAAVAFKTFAPVDFDLGFVAGIVNTVPFPRYREQG